MTKGAEFSSCGKYRYALWRIWDVKPFAMCIGLNPSTANHEKNDPTISRLTSLLTLNGYGGFYMMNLFALISSDPEDLRSSTNPVGDNDIWLPEIAAKCESVIFCWGQFPMAEYRARKIIYQYPRALCFGHNKNGTPKHPAGFIHAGIMNDDIKIVNFHR